MNGVFFSYSRQPNGAILADLHRRFNDEVQALVPGLSVFIDVGISAAQLWRDAIHDALDQSVVFLCVIEPSFWRSPFCVQEAREALDRADRDPDFWILPVLFQSIDSASLDPEARMLDDRLREYQGVDARAGIPGTLAEELAEKIKNLLERTAQAERLGFNLPRKETYELLTGLLDIHDLDRLLFEIPRLRPLIAVLPRAETPAEQFVALLVAIESKPELILTLLQALRRTVPKRAREVDQVLDLWRDVEFASAGRVSRDPLAQISDLLMDSLDNVLRELRSEPRFSAMFATMPREGSRSSHALWLVKALEARQLLTLHVRDLVASHLQPERAYALRNAFRHISVPERRQRLIDLFLAVFQADSLMILSWLQGDRSLGNMVSRSPTSGSALGIARWAVEQCETLGLLNERFFSRLLLFAPELSADIRHAASPWISRVPSPEKSFWFDHLVIFWAEMIQLHEYMRVMGSLGIPEEELVDEWTGVPALWICRDALSLLDRRGLLNRAILHQLIARYPQQRARLIEIEQILLSEEGAASPVAILPAAFPTDFSEAGTRIRSGWRERLVAFLCERFGTADLRRLARYLTYDLHSDLPRPPTRRIQVALVLVRGSKAQGLLGELFDHIKSERPLRHEEIASIRQEAHDAGEGV